MRLRVRDQSTMPPRSKATASICGGPCTRSGRSFSALGVTARGAAGTVSRFELAPPRRFVWQWYPGAVDASVDYSREPRTTVTFTLEPSGAGTRLVLAETGFDEISLTRRAKVYGDNSQGWTEVLGWLQQYAETAS